MGRIRLRIRREPSAKGKCKAPAYPMRVYEIKVGATGCGRPKIFESTGEDATTQGNDGIGSAHGPTHSGLFKALPDHCAAASLDHPRAHKEFLFAIFGIAHLRRIFLEVAQLFEHRLFALPGGGQVFAGLVKEAVDVARFQPIPPGFGGLGLLTPENLPTVVNAHRRGTSPRCGRPRGNGFGPWRGYNARRR